MGLQLSKRTPIEGLSGDDIVILMVGQSGTGKSTFINTVFGKEVTRVGEGLEPCTNELEHVRVRSDRYPRQLVFVDTPAILDPEETRPPSEKVFEKKVFAWMRKTMDHYSVAVLLRYGKKGKISGILYLHKITNNRITDPPSSSTNIRMFKRLIGEHYHHRVLLVTTMWEIVKPETGRKREKELVGFWQGSIEGGSRHIAHNGTSESAWRIVDTLLKSI